MVLYIVVLCKNPTGYEDSSKLNINFIRKVKKKK